LKLNFRYEQIEAECRLAEFWIGAVSADKAAPIPLWFGSNLVSGYQVIADAYVPALEDGLSCDSETCDSAASLTLTWPLGEVRSGETGIVTIGTSAFSIENRSSVRDDDCVERAAFYGIDVLSTTI
jgi:hypothetical protein